MSIRATCFVAMTAWLGMYGQAQQQQGGQQADTQEATAVVTGAVVRSDTGEPLKRATVTLRRTGVARGRTGTQGAGGRLSAQSGADGRFEIKGVAAGVYRVTAMRNGYLDAEYGQRGYGGSGAAITISQGQTVSGLTLKMLNGGVISGTVTNEDGEKLARASISVAQATYGDNGMTWMPANGAMTDDRGEYRVFGLKPGRYFVTASADFAQGFRRGPEAQVAEEGYPTLYFPGTTHADEASEVVVTAGAEAGGTDFRLMPVKLYKVRGTVHYTASSAATGAGQQGPGGGMRGPMGGGRPMVALLPEGRAVMTGMGMRMGGGVDAAGRFEIGAVAPGRYVLVGEMGSPNGQRESARVPVTVGATNVDNLEVTLTAVAPLRGELRVEPKGAADVTTLSVRVMALDGGGGGMYGGPGGRDRATAADGTFTVEGLGLQRYGVMVSGLPDTMYIKSVKLGDQDFTHTAVDLTGGVSGTLTVVVAQGTGTVSGNVTEGDRAAEGATVVLVPDAARRGLGRYFFTATTDQSGQFSLKGVPPGEYKLFAWDTVEQGAWRDPAWLGRQESKGKTVQVRPSAAESMQLALIVDKGEQ